MITFDDTRIERLLIKEYQHQLGQELRSTFTADDIARKRQVFEKKFAAYIGTAHALAVESGTDALQIALLTLGIGKGDQVIVPDITYPAVPMSVLYAGATPVIIDINSYLQIDKKEFSKSIQMNTKAVIVPHMFGMPSDIMKIIQIAGQKRIHVIEDCCQALGTSINDQKLGSWGDISCFSFALHKVLSSAGDHGGMLCFNTPTYLKANNLFKLWDCNEALISTQQHFSRMSFLDQITISVKWRWLSQIIKSRQQIKAVYEEELSNCRQLKILSPQIPAEITPQGFIIFCERSEYLTNYLTKNGIVCQKAYTPLHRIPIFKEFCQGTYKNSEQYNRTSVNLPIFSFMDKKDALFITKIIKKALRHC